MNYLADVNVWVAMTYDAHVHHRDATAWFDGATANGKGVNRVAFCRVTEMGLLRLLTNSRVMGEDVRSPAAAWATLDALYQDDRLDLRRSLLV